MSSSTSKSSTRAPLADGSNFVVLISILLVSLSISLGLNIHLGMDLVVASIVGFSLFIGLSGLQVWQRSSSENQALKEEINSLEEEVERLRVPSGSLSRDINTYKPTKIPIQTSFLEEKTPPPSGASISVVKENDVDAIQQRIKDMLTQVSTSEQSQAEVQVEETDSKSSDISLNEEIKTEASPSPEKSLGVLRSAMESLRSKPKSLGADTLNVPVSISSPEVDFSSSTIPSIPSSEENTTPSTSSIDSGSTPEITSSPDVSLIQQAIGGGRVEVFLEPILSLGEKSAKHYEVSIKLRSASHEDLGTFDSKSVQCRGVLPLVDTACFQRSALIAERLASQGRDGFVFTRCSGETLLDTNFNQLLEREYGGRQSLFRQLVLCLTQNDIRSFRADEQRAVGKLSSLGFRFAVLGVNDLDMNFDAMARAGFSFARLDTAVLTEGLPSPKGKMNAPDISGYLAKHDFTLIVDGIDDEETFARIYQYGVLFGQGSLFGGRRPVKAELISRSAQAAA